MELTYEQSVEAAKPIKEIVELARTLNVDYLNECLKMMKENHSWRDSAMVLNPNPHTALEKQDLNAAKIKSLELLLELAKNQDDIRNLTIKLHMAEGRSNKLSDLF